MSKNIAISDAVYDRLKREKGDRSFSEVIAARLDSGARLMDVTGARVLDEETMQLVDEELGRASERTVDRLTDAEGKE